MEYLSNKSSVARMDKNLEKISPFEGNLSFFFNSPQDKNFMQ